MPKPLISPELHEKRSRAGRVGGYATLFKYGRDMMILWSLKGGRPRTTGIAEIRQQQALKKNKKEAGLSLGSGLGIRELWREIRGEPLRNWLSPERSD